MIRISLGTILCVGLLLPLGVRAEENPSDGDFSTWTSQSGAEIQARFADKQGQTVVLETADGKQVRIRLNQLSPQDQVRANELAQADAVGGGRRRR